MEEVDGTGQGEKDKKGQHAGLEWEGIIQRYKEGLSSTPGGSHHLTEHDWGKPLLTQLPWEDVLFASILPHLEVRGSPGNIVNQSHLLIILSYSPMIGSHSLVPAKLLTRW